MKNCNYHHIEEKKKYLLEKLSKYVLFYDDNDSLENPFVWIHEYRNNFDITVNTRKKPNGNIKIKDSIDKDIRKLYSFGVPYFENTFRFDFLEKEKND